MAYFIKCYGSKMSIYTFTREVRFIRSSILLCNGQDDVDDLRELAGGIILSDPERFDTAFLGRSNQQYVDWLLREESWGGWSLDKVIFVRTG